MTSIKYHFVQMFCISSHSYYTLFTINQALNSSVGEWLMNNPELVDRELLSYGITEKNSSNPCPVLFQ